MSGDRDQILKDFGVFLALSFEVFIYTGGSVGLGYYLTTKQGYPWWTMVLSTGFGIGIVIYRMITLVRKLGRKGKQKGKNDGFENP